jgi:hypothetical protein
MATAMAGAVRYRVLGPSRSQSALMSPWRGGGMCDARLKPRIQRGFRVAMTTEERYDQRDQEAEGDQQRREHMVGSGS